MFSFIIEQYCLSLRSCGQCEAETRGTFRSYHHGVDIWTGRNCRSPVSWRRYLGQLDKCVRLVVDVSEACCEEPKTWLI